MSIVYALIAREDSSYEYGKSFHVLTEASLGDSTGNFPQVTREVVLPQVPRNQKSLYKYKDRYVFHTLNDEGFTYLCLADMEYPKTRAHVFLEEVKISFCNKFSPEQRESAISYGLNSFAEILLNKMEYYNENKLDPKLARIKNDAGATLGIMEQNLEAIMDRGDKIELLVKKANTLNVESGNLKQRSAILKEQARNTALKRAAIIGAGVLAIVYFAFLD